MSESDNFDVEVPIMDAQDAEALSDQPLREAALAIYEAHHPGHACPECLEEVVALVLERVTTTIEARRIVTNASYHTPEDGRFHAAVNGELDWLLAAVRGLGDTATEEER